jgi:dolichol-phosphate mannosyltransferase
MHRASGPPENPDQVSPSTPCRKALMPRSGPPAFNLIVIPRTPFPSQTHYIIARRSSKIRRAPLGTVESIATGPDGRRLWTADPAGHRPADQRTDWHSSRLSLLIGPIGAKMAETGLISRIVKELESHAVIIPTYNERENLSALTREILGLQLGSEIIIVDDNSPDGTGRLADELAEQYAGIRVVHRPRKLGLGTAHIAGMRTALALGTARIVTMDADFSHHPRYLPALLAALDHHDLVIGSRYVPGGGTRSCTLPRKLLSRGANLFARTVLSLHAGDATAGFRGYRRAVLESMPLDQIVSDGYSFLIEMLYYGQRQGWHVGEIPIIFENRQQGTSKISRVEILNALRTVVRLGWKRARDRADENPGT